MGRIRLDAAGLPFIGGALVLALVSGAAGARVLAAPFFVLGAFFVFFFRDPERRADTGTGDDVVLSPADGRVLVAGRATAEVAPPGDWQQVSIFLSPMDVHVNRMPVSGRITRVSVHARAISPGVPSRRRDGQRAQRDLDRSPRARRSSRGRSSGSWRAAWSAACDAGADVRAGDRFGIMKFGSRMDVFVPPSATLSVSVGQLVRGGETVIAVLH